MSLITKPMLAAQSLTKKDKKVGLTLDQVLERDLDFENKEYIATPKLDGIRALKIGVEMVSRSFKTIRNNHIQNILSSILPENADGEIVVPGAFQATSSGVMGSKGEPEFKYWCFDYVKDDLQKKYIERLDDLREMVERLPEDQRAFIVPLVPGEVISRLPLCLEIKSLEELKDYEQKCLDAGFEGVILRTKDSPYKCGRATAKTQYLLKIKRFEDGEAEILDFGEKMHNDNPKEKDNFGRSKRSSHQEFKRPAGMLGFLVVKDIDTGIQFDVGTGFNDELRQEIWDNKSTWKGLIIKYSHMPHGVKDKPRHPSYEGIRDKEDM